MFHCFPLALAEVGVSTSNLPAGIVTGKRLMSILSVTHRLHCVALVIDHFLRGECPIRRTCSCRNADELTGVNTVLELTAHLSERGLAHGTPQCISEQLAFINYRFPLEVPFLGKGDGCLRRYAVGLR